MSLLNSGGFKERSPISNFFERGGHLCDARQQLIIAADACNTGIGGVLLQRYADGTEKAVFHVSKSLSPAQRNYGQIEKEAFALVYTVERLKKFVWGRHFTLQTDHRPLLALFRTSQTKGLDERTAARLRRWALRLVGYDFDIEYVRTSEFGQADALSRLIQETRRDAANSGMDEVIASLEVDEIDIKHLVNSKVFTPTGVEVQKATSTDPVLRVVLERLRHGWERADFKSHTLRVFAQQADSLCSSQGILLLHDRLVVPSSLRPTVLRKLHRAHPGIVRMKALARAHFYWPGMSTDVETLVKSCAHCAQHVASPTKVPLAPWPDPRKPWVRLHMDYAEPQKGHSFLVIVDAFSKYVDATYMYPASCGTLVDYLRMVFRLLGPPETLVTDNGGQFTSASFAELCQEFLIIHLRSSPYSPMSNGLAEKMVCTLKNAIESTGPLSLDEAVSVYNYTPTASLNGKTPFETLFGRPRRSFFPIFRSQASTISDSSRKFKLDFDRHHGTRPRLFRRGEKVVVALDKRRRVPATFVEPVGAVLARLEVDGRQVVRHLNQIWKRAASWTDENDFPLELLPSSPVTVTGAELAEESECNAGPCPSPSLRENEEGGLSAPSVEDDSEESIRPIPPKELVQAQGPARLQPARVAKNVEDYGVLAGVRRMFGR